MEGFQDMTLLAFLLNCSVSPRRRRPNSRVKLLFIWTRSGSWSHIMSLMSFLLVFNSRKALYVKWVCLRWINLLVSITALFTRLPKSIIFFRRVCREEAICYNPRYLARFLLTLYSIVTRKPTRCACRSWGENITINVYCDYLTRWGKQSDNEVQGLRFVEIFGLKYIAAV